MTKQLVQVVNKVNNAAIRRVNVPGKGLFYVVPSYTLPDNCVMNGGLYPAEEIAASFETLNDTPAPVGHPYNENGEYIPANSPDGILFFQCGIFNKNVQRVSDDTYGHRVYVEKWVHVETAMQSERGKRVIEAIDNGAPIHSSTGVVLEPVPEIGVNAQGKEYTWRATNMAFDHDCILLSEEGAATPDDGVGLLVNKQLLTQVNRSGATLTVNSVTANTEQPPALGLLEVMGQKLDNLFAMLANHGDVANNRGKSTTQSNQEGEDMSLKTLMKEKLGDAYNEDMTDEEMLNAYEKSLKGNAAEQPEPTGEQEPAQGEQVVNADVAEQLRAIVREEFQANAQAAEKAERDEIAQTLTANKSALTRETQDKMTLNELHAVANTFKRQSAYGLPAGQMVSNHNESRFSDELPE